MNKTYLMIIVTLLAMIFACSDDTVLEPTHPESCTNTTCRPDMISFPRTYLNVNYDIEPDIIISGAGIVECSTEPSDCGGYKYRILEPIDSIYFACDELSERANALSLNDTIDTRLNYSQGGEWASEKIRIAEIYMDGEWDPFWNGPFVNQDIRYLGFKMIVSGKDHFGWVGLRISEYDGTLYLSTYCYKSTAGEAAIAGVCP